MIKLDDATEKRLSQVYPELAMRWRKAATLMWDTHKVMLKVAQGYRSFADQLAVWKQGRELDKKGKWIVMNERKVVTHAPPGQSYHQYGLALDSCFAGSDPWLDHIDKKEADFLWNEYGRFVKQAGLVWGGDWAGKKNDRPHCELNYGLDIHTVYALYMSGGVESVWNKCHVLSLCGREFEQETVV